MKATKILLVIFAFLLIQCDTNNNVDPRFEKFFIKYYGTEGDQSSADLHVNEDGTFIMLGNSVLPSGATSPFLIKTDPLGNVLWELNFGENEMAVDIEHIKRGPNKDNFIVASNVGNEENSRIRLWRISAGGVFIDSVTVTNASQNGKTQIVNSVTSLESQDGYVIAGYSDGSLIEESSPEIIAPMDRDILAFSIDESFSTIENIVNKGGELNGAGIKVFEMPNTSSGQMILFSYTDRPHLSNNFGFNFSYDIIDSGVPIGKLVGSEDNREILASVIKTPITAGEGFLMAGTSTANGNTRGDIYLVKFNNSFEYKGLDKKLNLGMDLECVAAENAPFGYYILSNEVVDIGLKDIVLMKVSPDGSVEWTRRFGAIDAEDTGSAVSALRDGRIAVLATMQLKTRKKMALIVVNSHGAL